MGKAGEMVSRKSRMTALTSAAAPLGDLSYSEQPVHRARNHDVQYPPRADHEHDGGRRT